MYHAEYVNVNEPQALFVEIDAGQHHDVCAHSIAMVYVKMAGMPKAIAHWQCHLAFVCNPIKVMGCYLQ